MCYDNGGFRESDLQSLAIQREMGLEETIKELRKEIDSLNKEISARDILIKSLKSGYILEKEMEIRNLEEANRHLNDNIKKLLKQLKDQSTVEDGEKAILDRVYKYIEIADIQDTQFTQLYRLDFIPSHYRLIINKTVRDYLISKGVKYKGE